MGVFEFDRAIVRGPAATVVHGLRAHGQANPTFDGIVHEHAAYVAALERAGLQVTELPSLPDYPDSIFVEDPALVFTEGAILLRPGTPTRANEAAELRGYLSGTFDVVHELVEGHVDGGDVLVTPHTVFIGLSDRTDEAGATALVDLLATFGRESVIAETPDSVLHLKTAASLVDEETILATAELAATGLFDRFRLLTAPAGEEGGANVLRVNDILLVGSAFPRTIELLAGHVPEMVPLDVAEVGKIDAGLTCMSLRWKAAARKVGALRAPLHV
jgi:dimethylargininase